MKGEVEDPGRTEREQSTAFGTIRWDSWLWATVVCQYVSIQTRNYISVVKSCTILGNIIKNENQKVKTFHKAS